MKNTPGKINNRLDRRGEKISELEDLAKEIFHNESYTHKHKTTTTTTDMLISEQRDSKLVP